MLLKIGGLIITNLDVGPSKRYNFWACLQGHFQVDLTMEAKSTLSVNCTVPWLRSWTASKEEREKSKLSMGIYPPLSRPWAQCDQLLKLLLPSCSYSWFTRHPHTLSRPQTLSSLGYFCQAYPHHNEKSTEHSTSWVSFAFASVTKLARDSNHIIRDDHSDCLAQVKFVPQIPFISFTRLNSRKAKLSHM